MVEMYTMWFEILNNQKLTIFSIILTLILSFVFAGLLDYYGSTKLRTTTIVTPLEISPNKTAFGPIIMKTTGANYFKSIGRVYVNLWSPYAQYFTEFTIEMSLDGYYWHNVPIPSANPDPDNFKKWVDIGLVDLNKVSFPILARSNIPPQNILIPGNITEEQLSKSFRGGIHIHTQRSPRDKVIGILVIITLWNTLLRIVDMVLLRPRS